MTAVGIDPLAAAEQIRQMHGANRIPTLLKRVDRLTRGLSAFCPLLPRSPNPRYNEPVRMSIPEIVFA